MLIIGLMGDIWYLILFPVLTDDFFYRQTPQNKRQEYVNAFNGGNQRSSCKLTFTL